MIPARTFMVLEKDILLGSTPAFIVVMILRQHMCRDKMERYITIYVYVPLTRTYIRGYINTLNKYSFPCITLDKVTYTTTNTIQKVLALPKRQSA